MILREGIEIFHASYKVVDKIDLFCCSEGKDFGKGFYLTTDFEQACKFVKTSIKKALINGVDVENDRWSRLTRTLCKQYAITLINK